MILSQPPTYSQQLVTKFSMMTFSQRFYPLLRDDVSWKKSPFSSGCQVEGLHSNYRCQETVSKLILLPSIHIQSPLSLFPRSKSPTKAGASCKAKVVFWNGHWMAISSQIITVAERLITPPMIHSLKRTNIAAHPPKKQMQVEVTLEKSSSPSNFNRGFATVSGKAKMFQKQTLLKIHTMTFKNAFLKAGLRSPCFYHPNSNPTSYSFVKFARKNCTSWRHVKSWICSNELVIARHLVIILESDDKSFSPDFGGRKI